VDNKWVCLFNNFSLFYYCFIASDTPPQYNQMNMQNSQQYRPMQSSTPSTPNSGLPPTQIGQQQPQRPIPEHLRPISDSLDLLLNKCGQVKNATPVCILVFSIWLIVSCFSSNCNVK
jgi:hypothetical protein